MGLPRRIGELFERQARACAALGSPFAARLCRMLPDALDGELRARVAGWPGSARADALVLRVKGGLHALARDGRCAALSAAYPPGEADLNAGLAAAMAEHQAFLLPWLDHAPQTNEVARSGVLLGVLLTVMRRTGLPLELLEIGSSAGLNLALDRYGYDLGRAGSIEGAEDVVLRCDWRGAAPVPGTLDIMDRAGSDLAPVDARDPAARERMLAYLWPDQRERIARATAALAVIAASGWRVERAEAADWVEDRLARPSGQGRARVLMHSIMWQYLPEASRARIRLALLRAGEKTTPATPLAWARMEDDDRPGAAAILLTLWPGGRTEELGRADFHGRKAVWSGRPRLKPGDAAAQLR